MRPWTVHHGDAWAWLAAQADDSVDHVICDPPFDQQTTIGQRSNKATRSNIDFGALQPGDIERIVSGVLRVCRRWAICFCAMEQLGAYRLAAGSAWVRSGFWRRLDGPPQFTGDRPAQPGEGIAIMHAVDTKKRWNGHGRHAFWATNICKTDRVHPTQKPLPLMRALIEDFTNPGDLVADPFMGSGSTGVACIQTGRRFVGVERDARYYAIARERLAAAVEGHSLVAHRAGQTTMLGLLGPEGDNHG